MGKAKTSGVLDTATYTKYSEVYESPPRVAKGRQGQVVQKAMGHEDALKSGINVAQAMLLANRGRAFGLDELMACVKDEAKGRDMFVCIGVANHIFGLAANRVGEIKPGDVEFADVIKSHVMIR